jgi:uncharacterized protein YbcI
LLIVVPDADHVKSNPDRSATERVTLVQKIEQHFNEIVRKIRKEFFGKGPEKIKTVFVDNMAVSTLHGNLTPVEKFIAQTEEGKETVRLARTKLIQHLYKEQPPLEMEALVGSRLLHLFSDFKVEEDMAVSVFVFENKIVVES